MVLFARSLGASASLVGVLMGMTPLFTALQLVGARYVEGVGYKRWVLAGWTTRTYMILAVVALPWLSCVWSDSVRLGVLMGVMLLFCIIRGLSSCAWLPWLTKLVPAGMRAHYMVREQSLMMVSSILTAWVAGGLLGEHGAGWAYSLVFFIAFAGGLISLVFIRKMPDVEVSPTESIAAQPVPWGAIWGYRPFRRVVCIGLVWTLAQGGLQTFALLYLRNVVGWGEGVNLRLLSAVYVGGAAGLWGLASFADRWGSRPVILSGVSVGLVALGGWFALVEGWWPPTLVGVAVLWFAGGVAALSFGAGHMRWLMGVVPEMGRSHFFAMATAFQSLVLALAPMAWGFVIDVVNDSGAARGAPASGYALFFGGASMILLLLPWVVARSEEAGAPEWHAFFREVLGKISARALARWWDGDRM
jgi:Na+/melibiose symporter-like transporter